MMVAAMMLIIPSQPVHVRISNDIGQPLMTVQSGIEQDRTVTNTNEFIREFYPNGQLAFVQTMRNGKIDGIVRAYYEDGALKGVVNYVENHQEGVSREYYPDGHMKEEVIYENGQMKDLKQYDANGRLVVHRSGKFKEDCVVVK